MKIINHNSMHFGIECALWDSFSFDIDLWKVTQNLGLQNNNETYKCLFISLIYPMDHMSPIRPSKTVYLLYICSEAKN